MTQHLARLGPLGRPHDAAGLHQVHQPAGLGEADPQFALQHRRRAELAGDHQFDGLQQDIHIVADIGIHLGAVTAGLGGGDALGVIRLGLVFAGLDHGLDLPSLMWPPCNRIGLLAPIGRNSPSPMPISFSAPG